MQGYSEVGEGMTVQIEWKPQDMWVGVFWKRRVISTDVWICLVPCFPIHIYFLNKLKIKAPHRLGDE